MSIPCKEIEIPVPWGHVAGKVWGNTDGRPLLAIHGKQDNCGVFDRIIPSLLGNYHILAIDLPGHGLSSHYPSHVPLDFLNDIIAVVSVLEYVHWKRVFLLGHSMGGQIGVFLAATFPEYVEKLIVIDHVSPTNGEERATKLIRSHVSEFLQLHTRLTTGKEPVYTYQQALDKLTNRTSTLTNEAAEIVLKRSLKKHQNGYAFRMDQRLKLRNIPLLTNEHICDLLSNIQCPILCIFSSERFSLYEIMFKDAFVVLRKKPNYREQVVNGKSWGNPGSTTKCILLLHGIQHNCAAFDRLIPLLPKDYTLVAIDLPGHGFSSHYPSGLPLEFYNYVHCIKRCVDYLEWHTFTIVAHSFGSQLGTYFASIFPGYVDLLIVIDSMEPRPVPVDDTLQHLRIVAQQHFDLDKKLSSGESPVYTYEEVFQKTQKNRIWPLSNEATEDLLKRSIVPYKKGFRFVADQRLKYPMRPVLTFEQQMRILDSVICPVLFILAKSNMERYGSYLSEVYEYNTKKENCEIVVVEGDHAVHQNHPERVSSLINKKILEYEMTKCKS